MAGAYCIYCGRRCFVLRLTPDRSWSGHMATCPEGMAHDRRVLGYDHTTAINPTHPAGQKQVEIRADAALGLTSMSVPNEDGDVVWIHDIGYQRDEIPRLVTFLQAAYRAASATSAEDRT